jgi:hypothetical protein
MARDSSGILIRSKVGRVEVELRRAKEDAISAC